ncbi:MAG: argininosuccinate lyase [Paracoccus denitrificans]|nr:MAG: argininosuccinate lyase [Paracoccus denitrificans]PZO85136.1 MAG: argininosuccinate lyase [Paracoccus denitrificans]
MIFALAGCGIDGDPVPPSGSTTTPGITVSGDAQIGMRGTL